MYLAISWKVVPYSCHDILDVVTSLELMKKKKKKTTMVSSIRKKMEESAWSSKSNPKG